MVNDKRKGIVSCPDVNLENNDAANTSRSETTISSPTKMNAKGTGVTLESKGKEENAIRDMNNGKIVADKEKNEETVIEEGENNEDNTMEEDKEKEPNAMEEDDAQNGTEEEEEEEEGEEEEENEDEEEEEKEEDKEENRIEKEKNEEKVGASSTDKVKRSRKRSRKKMAQGASETVAAKAKDKTGSSSKKKVSKRAESMGLIFMCSSKTKKDCYRYNVLGLPASKRDTVQKVYKGMRLFLFDFDLRLMYGIYKAAGPGGYNIEPTAFKSAFPSQVRFTVLEDCLPLPEEKFKTVIKDNYYSRNKFNCELTSKQVKDLCKLFSVSNRGSKSRKLSRNPRAEARTRVDRGRIRRRSPDERRRSALAVDRRYRDRPIMYERETFASRAVPPPRLPPLPPPTATAPYVSYGRTLEMDVYRQEPVIERRDPRLLNLDLRHHQDEIESHDPYISYREPPSYRDSLYSVGLPPEYNPPPAGLRAEYRSIAAPPPEYLHPAAAPSEYGRHRPLYRY